MATFTLQNKPVTVTLTAIFRHGKNPTMAELANFKFTDAIFDDGRQLKDITFQELANQAWTLQNKNYTTLTYEPKS